MPKLSSLSVFFPCYNEEANVERMIRQAQGVLPEVAEQWEIIPVDDGSRDKTGEIIDRLAAEDPRVRPIHHEKNKGYGGAVISGYKAARYDFVFFTDGDLQFDLREITLLIEKIDEGDLILGYRKNRRDSALRKLNAFMWGSLVKMLFGFKVRDVDCAFKLMKRRVLEKVELTAGGSHGFHRAVGPFPQGKIPLRRGGGDPLSPDRGGPNRSQALRDLEGLQGTLQALQPPEVTEIPPK